MLVNAVELVLEVLPVHLALKVLKVNLATNVSKVTEVQLVTLVPMALPVLKVQ